MSILAKIEEQKRDREAEKILACKLAGLFVVVDDMPGYDTLVDSFFTEVAAKAEAEFIQRNSAHRHIKVL